MLNEHLNGIRVANEILAKKGVDWLPDKLKDRLCECITQKRNCAVEDIERFVDYIIELSHPSNNAVCSFLVTECLTFCDYDEQTLLGEVFCKIFNTSFVYDAYISESKEEQFMVYAECNEKCYGASDDDDDDEAYYDDDIIKVSKSMRITEFLELFNTMCHISHYDYACVIEALSCFRKLKYETPMYAFYLSLPLANIRNYNKNPLYNNSWVCVTGLGYAPPNPHRHYTLNEFKDKLSNNQEFIDFYNKYRFMYHKDIISEFCK